MKAAIEDNDIGAASGVTREPQGGFYRFGARVGKSDRVNSARHTLGQPIRQIQHGLVGNSGVLRMNNLAYLLTSSSDYCGVAVTGTGNANTGSKVQIAFTVDVKHPTAFAPFHTHLTGLLQQW